MLLLLLLVLYKEVKKVLILEYSEMIVLTYFALICLIGAIDHLYPWIYFTLINAQQQWVPDYYSLKFQWTIYELL